MDIFFFNKISIYRDIFKSGSTVVSEDYFARTFYEDFLR